VRPHRSLGPRWSEPFLARLKGKVIERAAGHFDPPPLAIAPSPSGRPRARNGAKSRVCPTTIPRPAWNPRVAILHAVVQIKRRHRPSDSLYRLS